MTIIKRVEQVNATIQNYVLSQLEYDEFNGERKEEEKSNWSDPDVEENEEENGNVYHELDKDEYQGEEDKGEADPKMHSKLVDQ